MQPPSFISLVERTLLKKTRCAKKRRRQFSRLSRQNFISDIPVGETAILINHTYQPADTPYHGTHAIYLREGCTHQGVYINEIPESLAVRLISLRAFDENHFMLEADICDGAAAKSRLNHFFDDPTVSYVHIHYAKQGCYACLAERVQ